jgi:non-heme chloroperoxidase
MNNSLAIARAVLKKDSLSLLPLLLLAAVVHMLDVFVHKLDILPLFAQYMTVIWFAATALVIFAVLQLDSPVSLVDDWLCRPVPKRILVPAKLLLLLAAIYLPRMLAMFIANLMLGYAFTESLQEAVLLQMNQPLVAFSAVMLIAIITPNVIQGMGTVLALVITVIVFLGERGPAQSRAGNSLSENGMVWMASAPVKILAFALVGVGFWAVYRYRNVVLGRWLLVAGSIASALMILAPIKADWHTVYALQKAVSPHDTAGMQAVDENLKLYHASACFPSTTVGALTGDAAYDSARQAFGVNPWVEAQLKKAGKDGLLFITRVQPQGIPSGWRMNVAHVEAVFTDAKSGEQIILQPAEVGGAQFFASLSHQWLLQQDEVARLAQGAPSLELTYSMALLKPLTHELAADGVRRKLDGLGYCGATRDNLNNRIVVDCFNGGAHAPQISAQMKDIDASRVYSSPPDYAPALFQATSGRRIELSVGPASLLPSAIVEVTAWRLAGFVDANVRSEGVLGNADASCPLPSSVPPPLQLSNWQDDSPHTASYIAVDDGVQLEVLDWGGTGMPLLLLAGMGATAHNFDDIAPLLAQNYRVIGLTRRGFGGSSRPESGYDTATLARDLVRVLDAIAIDKAIIVGSSIAGEEMSWLGAEYPERVAGLVYLDAAFDRVALAADTDFNAPPATLPPQPPIAADDLRSYATMLQSMQRNDTDPIPQGEMLVLLNISNRFMAGLPAVDFRLVNAIMANLQRPRFEAISAPVLALYAIPEGADHFMKSWYDRNDPRVLQQVAAMTDNQARLKREQMSLFQQLVPRAETKEMLNASHLMHLSHRDEVVAEIRSFVDRVHPASP